VENKLNKITNLSEKKPTQAIIYMLLSAVITLAGVIVWQNNKLGNKDEEKEIAVNKQRAADVEEINFWKAQYKDIKKEKDDCNNLVVTRADQEAIRDKQRLDYLEESFQKSILTRKRQAVSIKKLAEDIPTVKSPVINQTNEN